MSQKQRFCRRKPLIQIAAAALLAIWGNAASALAEEGIPSTPLPCDDSIKTSFKPDKNTTVTLVKFFAKGSSLSLNDAPSKHLAANDLCVVKLNVGPGNPGPAGATSTSAGIGIEIWLPSPANWSGRLHIVGGGGFSGDPQISSLTDLSGVDFFSAATIAGTEGSVSAITDTGHVSHQVVGHFTAGIFDGSFAMNPDGGINKTLWRDYSSRGIHEMAVKTKALAAAYYAQPVKYAYFDGCSVGGRQGHMEAQASPQDFNGILAGGNALNFSRPLLYPQIVIQRDLGGKPLSTGQLALVSGAAISACDSTVTGKHDGFISDPAMCKYDPTLDPAVLCKGEGGTNATASCVSKVQAQAINKMWYGETKDGSVPAPSRDNGYADRLAPDQLWFGITRGTLLSNTPLELGVADSVDGVPTPTALATDQIALVLQNPRLAAPTFHNATGDGADEWKSLSYADLARADQQGITLQPEFGYMDTNNPDLTRFRASGGKMISYHGLADEVIPVENSTSYYVRTAEKMGGYSATKKFYRYFTVPGMGHCFFQGSATGIPGVSPPPNPPLPAPNQLFGALIDWVEKGVAPEKIVLKNSDASMSRPICAYPEKLAYLGGDVAAAENYTCH